MRNQITQIRPHSWITQTQLSRITQIRAARKNGSRRSVLRPPPDHADPGSPPYTGSRRSSSAGSRRSVLQERTDHADPSFVYSRITQIREYTGSRRSVRITQIRCWISQIQHFKVRSRRSGTNMCMYSGRIAQIPSCTQIHVMCVQEFPPPVRHTDTPQQSSSTWPARGVFYIYIYIFFLYIKILCYNFFARVDRPRLSSTRSVGSIPAPPSCRPRLEPKTTTACAHA